MKPEERLFNAVKRRILKLKKVHPIFWFRFHEGGRNKRGIPDLSMTLYGFAIFVELKAGKNKATPLQLKRIEEIRSAGGFADVVRSVDEFDALLQSVIDHCCQSQVDGGVFSICSTCRRPTEFADCCGGERFTISRDLERGRIDVDA